MESSSGGRCGEIASDMSIILVTAVQLIFLTSFHRYIAWPTTGPDGSTARQSLLTGDYFTWLPFPITASILVIVATIVMIVYDKDWFRQAGWIVFCLIGITVTVSLLAIFPFDFSAIPNAAAVDVVPRAVTVFLILWAVMYGVGALVLSRRFLRSNTVKKGTG